MKNGLVCQLDFGHKIWGAVSVVMKVSVGLANLPVDNPIFGRFACYEGLLQQISDRPLLHAIVHEAF